MYSGMKGETKTIEMHREGQFLQIGPPCDELRSALRTSTHVLTSHGAGLVICFESNMMFRETSEFDQPVIDCFAGLQPVAERVLATTEYNVQYYCTVQPLQAPDFARVSELGPCDVAMLEMIQRHDRSLVKYAPSNVKPAWLVAQITLAWPLLSIAVVVTRVVEARHLQSSLLKYVPNVAVITSKDHAADEQVGRVVVATYNGLGHSGIEIEKRNIVIALNAVEASRVGPLSCLGHARRARMYGLVPLDKKLAPFDKHVVRVLFGFDEVTIESHGTAATEIQVVMLKNSGGVRLTANIDLTELKRRAIWHNSIRNRRIARLAENLIQGKHLSMQQLSSALADAVANRPLAVLVLVENLEHGSALQRRLPGWPLVAKDKSPDASIESEEVPFHAVVTWEGLKSLRHTGVDVIIRADGGTGLPPIVDRVTGTSIIYGINNVPDEMPHVAELSPDTASIYSKNNLILVDFDDRHHQILRRWSRQRRLAYEEQGWYAPGVNPTQARVDQFLAAVPKEAT